MRRPLVIYDFATAPFWISFMRTKFSCLFYQCSSVWAWHHLRFDDIVPAAGQRHVQPGQLVQVIVLQAHTLALKTGYKQCCVSGMFIPNPDFYPSRIPDPGSRIPDLGSRIPDPKTATKERGEKNLLSYLFM